MKITNKQLKTLVLQLISEDSDQRGDEDGRQTVPAPNFDPKQAYKDAGRRNADRKVKDNRRRAISASSDNDNREDSRPTAILPPPLKKGVNEDAEVTPNTDGANKYRKAIEISVNSLQEILHEMDSGSGEEGMSSYYVGTEIEKVVGRLVKVAAWYKVKGQKQ